MNNFQSHVQQEQIEDYYHTPCSFSKQKPQGEEAAEANMAPQEERDDGNHENEFVSRKQAKQLSDYACTSTK